MALSSQVAIIVAGGFMLWSTIGLLTAAVLVLSLAQVAHSKAFLRTRWIGRLMCGWTLNFAIGLTVLVLANADIITNYWVWKPLMMASSFAFMALVATVLHVNRNIPANDERTTPTRAWVVAGLGLAGVAAGSMVQAMVVTA
jgi:hypothetical protein